MTRFFTHYWRNETLDKYRASGDVDLEWLAGNDFVKRGVDTGDVVYPVTVYEGVLYLIGRIEAGRVCDRKKAEEHLGYKPSFEASQYVIATQPTTKHLDLEVPSEITRELRFITSGGTKPPAFESSDLLDRQTMRGVRELAPDSAALLDRLLSSAHQRASALENAIVSDLDSLREEEEYFEGRRKQRFVNYYEPLFPSCRSG